MRSVKKPPVEKWSQKWGEKDADDILGIANMLLNEEPMLDDLSLWLAAEGVYSAGCFEKRT